MLDYEHIKSILKEKEDEMQSNWNRMLPRAELLNNRWEKAKALGFEDKANIYDMSYVFGDVRVGESTWVGPYTLLDGTGGLTIGAFCNISAGVQIYTHSSMDWVLTGGKAEYIRESTSIGDCTYVGSMSIVNMGVSIGHHCVVAANSFVNKSVDDYTVVAGNPAKVIGKVVIEDNKVHIEYIKKE